MLFDTLLLFIYFLDIKYMFKQKKIKNGDIESEA